MIILVEMQCKDWIHNRVNAGIIKLLHEVFPEEQLRLYAEEKHIEGIKALIGNNNISISFETIEFYNWGTDSEHNVANYEQEISTIIENEKSAQRIIFLSCNNGIIMAANNVSARIPDKEIYLTLHGALERILFKISLRERFKKSVATNPNRIMQKCINDCKENNLKFIIYSPCYKKYLKRKISKRILDKFVFLHHPVYDSFINELRNSNDKVTIGVYGQAANGAARDIIKYYNEKYDNGRVVFFVVVKDDNPILQQKNVERAFNKNYVSNEELEKFISGLDYIMLPYTKDQYRVTASGVFCDAISQEIPLLMLDSPYFKYYAKYNIGIIHDSIDEMASCLSDLQTREKTQFVKNEKALKKILLQENVIFLKEKL